MSLNAQRQILQDLRDVIRRHRYESDITYTELVGLIEFLKMELIEETRIDGKEKNGDTE